MTTVNSSTTNCCRLWPIGKSRVLSDSLDRATHASQNDRQTAPRSDQGHPRRDHRSRTLPHRQRRAAIRNDVWQTTPPTRRRLPERSCGAQVRHPAPTLASGFGQQSDTEIFSLLTLPLVGETSHAETAECPSEDDRNRTEPAAPARPCCTRPHAARSPADRRMRGLAPWRANPRGAYAESVPPLRRRGIPG